MEYVKLINFFLISQCRYGNKDEQKLAASPLHVGYPDPAGYESLWLFLDPGTPKHC